MSCPNCAAAEARAEEATRERDSVAYNNRLWHDFRKKVEAVFDYFVQEVMPIAHVEDHLEDPEVLVPYLDAWFDRLEKAESERDALASRLARAEEALREIADLDCDGGCGCAQRIARAALAPGEKEENRG